MASKIVPGNVDGTYPKAGQDNSSQGFRDNFSAIKTNFTEAQTEIEDLQRNKANLNSSSDFADNEVTRAKFKDTAKDAYPIIRKKGPEYFKNYVNDHEIWGQKPGAERGVFFELFNRYSYLPITTDSHLGEYIQWAYSVADHEAILEFYTKYREKCLTFYENEKSYQDYFDLQKKPKERVVAIIEGIIQDLNYEEAAVNLPNKGYIEYLPENIVVEVPGIINKEGIHGIKLENYPFDFSTLLLSQVSVMRLTAEAILEKSKDKALKALLADPVVNNVSEAEKLLNHMIEKQYQHLGYLI